MNSFLHDASEKLVFMPGILFAFFTIFIIHELGHYWAARLRKMRVETFSIGWGRRLWGVRDRHGTEWVFRLFPLGGHVHINDLTLESDKKSRRSVGTRLFVVLAGPAANILFLPFVILPLCFILIGFPIQPPLISGVEIGTPAAKGGLMRGDIVTHINGQSIISYDELGDMILDSQGQRLHMRVRRGEEIKDLQIIPKKDAYEDLAGILRERYRIGILNSSLPTPLRWIYTINGQNTKDDPDLARTLLLQTLGTPIHIGLHGADDRIHVYPVTIPPALNTHLDNPDHKYYSRIYLGPLNDNAFVSLTPVEAIKKGGQEAAKILSHIIRVPLQIFPIDPMLFSERIPFMSESKYYYENLIYRAAYQTALLSIVIGFINLIPFPRLDGDFTLTYLMEAVLKKKPSRKARAIALCTALFLIYTIILFANLGDIPGYIEMKLEDWNQRLERWGK